MQQYPLGVADWENIKVGGDTIETSFLSILNLYIGIPITDKLLISPWTCDDLKTY
jgi:hypothetical protein